MKELDFTNINEYFEQIKTDENLNDILLIEKFPNKDKKQIYEYLKNNNVLYAGGKIDNDDLEKVRNVMIRLWLKANENNKKYARNDDNI